jgi:hypothetical protein
MVTRLKIFLFFSSLVVGTSAHSQISYGGQPLPFETSQSPLVLPSIPAESITTSVETDNRVGPLRFAHPFFVNYSCGSHGEWFPLPDGGRLWRIHIKSPGALSLNVIFDRFKLPKGGKLFAYAPDRSHVLGAFTHESNVSSGLFALAPVKGDELILEYSAPAEVSKEPELVIGAVNHDYLGVYDVLNKEVKAGRFGDSGDCNIDADCSTDTPKDVMRSVCKIIVDGTELCSGTLINNVRNDGTPYFLTAAHCLTKATSDQTIVFFFNYESPGCISFVEGSKVQTLSGSTRKAQVDTLDFALVEMDQVPPASYRPYWAGWNLAEAPNPPFKTIHHPNGDVKKISLETDPISVKTFNNNTVDGDPFAQLAHWKVNDWESGTTEPGSSGAGLFDSKNALVGTLSGGSANCTNPVNDYFACFKKYWNHVPANESQVKKWLDPDDSGATELTGLDYYNDKYKKVSVLERNDQVGLVQGGGMKGYWSGHNSAGYSAYAQYYNSLESATIHGVYLMLGKSQRNASTRQTIDVKFWIGDSTGPETLIADTIGHPISLIPSDKVNLISLEEPVNVSGTFFISVSINYDIETDTVALYQIEKSGADLVNHAYIYDGHIWQPYTDLHPTGQPANYWIDVLASNVVFTDNPEVVKPNVLVYPNPVRDGIVHYKYENIVLDYVDIFSTEGKLVQRHFFSGNQPEGYILLPRNIPSGLYLLHFVGEKYSNSKKLMVF